jgi:Fe-S-cluster containining protein
MSVRFSFPLSGRHCGPVRSFCKHAIIEPMVRLSGEQVAEFRTAVERAARRKDVRAAVENVYVALQDAIDLRNPRCVGSGRCCKFDDFGHNLFITTMEMATFAHDLPEADQSTAGIAATACPFQVGKLCSIHTIRPFGCRIFFCDETSTEWQRRQYARFHSELKRLHEELSVPYYYIEWRKALVAYFSSPTSVGRVVGPKATF